MLLTINAVEEIFIYLLFSESEDTSKYIKVHGIVNSFGFCPKRVEEKKSDIGSLLTQLPKEFLDTEGGGYSFLSGCINKEGEQWGNQQSAELLFCLGMACGYVVELFPRSLWSVLPGGVPYYMVVTQDLG